MIYNSEIVRRNIKYMRKFYGVTQTELSKVLDVDIDFIFEFLNIIFPKFLFSETMEDVYFQKGCKCLNSIQKDFKENKVISIKKYEECIDLFLQSYRKFQTFCEIVPPC